MARLTSDLVLSLTDRVSGPARGVGRSLDQLDRRTAASVTGMGRASTMMLAGAGSILAPLAGGAAVKEAVSQAADFESALTEIQKKAGTTAEQTATLGEEIKDLATSGKLAVPIEEILGAYERGAAAGIPIAELREFAEMSVKASDAFGMSAEQVGNFAAKLKTGLGMSNEEVRKVLDLTNSLADAGIADESSIVDYMDRVGATLKTLGMNSGNSLALGSTMLNLGMTAEVAATGTDALANKLLTVSQLTGKKRASFEKYMGGVGKFSKLIRKDANGALLTMLDRLNELNSEDRMAFLTDFVGQDHAGKVLRVAGAIDELRKNQALAANEAQWFGSLDKSYALKLDDMKSQWQLFKNQASELMIDVGTAGMPALKSGLEGAKYLVDQIGQGFESFKADLDMPEVTAAGAAISTLSSNLARLLNTNPNQSALGQFFREMADAVNDIAASINKIDEYINRSVERVPDASKLTPEQRKVREEYMSRFMPNTKAAVDARPTVAAGKEGWTGPATAPKGSEGQSGPTLEVAPRYGPQLPAIPTQRPGRSIHPTAQPVRAPIPTPRPDFVGPVKAEGDAAALAAEQAGQRIADAFSVTATATVRMDDAAIDVSQAKADRLISTLARVGSAARTAAQQVNDSAATIQNRKVDFDGLHADLTHHGF